MRASERRFADLFESAPDATVITNRHGVITLVNGQAEQMFGWTRAELVGRPVEMLLPRHVRTNHVTLREGYVRSAAVPRSMGAGRDLRAVRKTGEEFPVEISLSPMTSDGEMVVAAAVRDVSERKLLEVQFLQAQKMESVGQLASGIAHDFNNLLTVINSTAELAALDLREDDLLREELADICRAGGRAAALTRQFLAFGRKQILQPTVVNLNAVVRNIESMLRRVIGDRIDLALRLADDLVNVRVDAGQIEQVILNLAINGRDAMSDGGTLTFETRNAAAVRAIPGESGQPALHAVLAISDTGVGMDEATQQKMFEPFFTTKGPGKGTGLGLSTAYGIVKQSGGDISVTSEIGRGTTIAITLPGVDEPARAQRTTPVSTMAVSAAWVKETILVVEDEETIRRLVRRILQGAGYKVLLAATGVEALSLLEQADGPIHLMVTDMIMPGMSGAELAERVGKRHPETRILFTSGYTDDVVSHADVLGDGAHFIGKPFAAMSLTRKVREVLDQRP